MRGNFLRGVVVGSLAAVLVLGASAALAGTGIGGVFNLGQSNTVNHGTSLTGSSTGPQLTVSNAATSSGARGLSVSGASASAALIAHNGAGPAAAFLSPNTAVPFTVNSSVQVPSLNASLLGGHTAGFFLPATGTATNAAELGGLPAKAFYQSRTTPLGTTLTTVDSSGTSVGVDTSITIGADGLPIISYFDFGNGHLKVVHCTDLSCSSHDPPQTLDTSTNVGAESSIAIGADGLPIISYLDGGSDGHLKVVHCTDVSCSSHDTPQTLDSTTMVGKYTSIAIGADGFPVISYYDFGNGALKVLHCETVSCSSVDSPQSLGTGFGAYSSIAIGADGLPIISSAAGTTLAIVHCTDIICSSHDTPQAPDANTPVGEFTSIAIGGDGLPIISYDDEGSGHLKVVHCTDVNCSSTDSPQTVDGSPGVGQYTSITIGADGLPIVSYFDGNNGHLKVVHCTALDCSSTDPPQTVDNNSEVGEYTSITIGIDGLPIISYYDFGNGHLKVAHCASPYCVPYFRRR